MSADSPIVLREVIESDLVTFHDQQLDKEACLIAAFHPREGEAFYAHWHKIMTDKSNILRTIMAGGLVAGNIVSFVMSGEREVGYWLGREYWGKGIATLALVQFLKVVTERPLYAFTAKTNLASQQVLLKCGFTPLGQISEEVKFHLT